MNITERNVTLKNGGNSLTTYLIFENEAGEEFIAVDSGWRKLLDDPRERHDHVKFLQEAARRTGVATSPVRLSEAFLHTTPNQRTPRKILNKALNQLAPDEKLKTE